MPGLKIPSKIAAKLSKEPQGITAFFVGLNSKIAIFGLQRSINEFKKEPLMAVLPGVALQELWSMMSLAEQALATMSIIVVVIGLIGMMSLMLSGLNERRREMAILRTLGARPHQIILLIVGEALLLTLLAICLGLFLLYLLLLVGQPMVFNHLGFHLPIGIPSDREWLLMGLVALAGLLVGWIPGLRAYRLSLSDGMSIRT
jgi:putative ABC transport system permease protein